MEIKIRDVFLDFIAKLALGKVGAAQADVIRLAFHLFEIVQAKSKSLGYVPYMNIITLKMVLKKDNKYIRFHWVDDEDDKALFLALTSQLLIAVLNARLYELSITDGLTGLYVHRYFEQRLREEISRAKRYAHRVSLIMIDIDYFKRCNDLYGHQTGTN